MLNTNLHQSCINIYQASEVVHLLHIRGKHHPNTMQILLLLICILWNLLRRIIMITLANFYNVFEVLSKGIWSRWLEHFRKLNKEIAYLSLIAGCHDFFRVIIVYSLVIWSSIVKFYRSHIYLLYNIESSITQKERKRIKQ